MAKTRIVETVDGQYMPQYKTGFLDRWRFMHVKADQGPMAVTFIDQPDPAKAAIFSSEAEAKEFLARFWRAADSYWDQELAAGARAFEGVRAKRVITFKR